MIDRISIPISPGIVPSKPVIKDGDKKRRDQPPPQPQKRNKSHPDYEDKNGDGMPHIDEYI